MPSSMRIALCAVGLLVGCQRSKEEVVAGTEPSKPTTTLGVERADCRPDHTCDTGLLCLSNLCVRPPAADCTLLGETLASLELGNYAPREQRNALVTDKRTRCEREHVTKDEQKCVDEAHADKWAIAKCVPRLFPEMQPGKGAAGDCELVVAKIQQMMGTQLQQSADPQVAKMIATATTVVRTSCLEDGWSDALRQCVIKLDVSGKQNDAMRACEGLMPPGLEQKMTQRMSAAMAQP